MKTNHDHKVQRQFSGETMAPVTLQGQPYRRQKLQAERSATPDGRSATLARSGHHTQPREPAIRQNGGLAITPGHRYSAEEKALILDTVQRAQQLCPERPLSVILADLGLTEATYYRWCENAVASHLADRLGATHCTTVLPTPAEVQAVVSHACAHPLLGYKQLAYALMAENKAFLRPWIVYSILAEAGLLGRHAPEPLTRLTEATRPDQRWHANLMLWWFGGHWFWLIYVMDAYSRYLVHCEALLTARADVVALAAQRALDTLRGGEQLPGEPEIVHGGRPQFIEHEWAHFVQEVRLTNGDTPPCPQSDGWEERVDHTFREETSLDEIAVLYEGQAFIVGYRAYYNERRPHSALHYLCPLDYYRGNPTAQLAEREVKLQAAEAARQAYWEAHRP